MTMFNQKWAVDGDKAPSAFIECEVVDYSKKCYKLISNGMEALMPKSMVMKTIERGVYYQTWFGFNWKMSKKNTNPEPPEFPDE